MPNWLPYIPESKLSDGGRIRTLLNPDGSQIVERLESFSESKNSYSYSILEAPFPVTNYFSTLKVRSINSDTSEVIWSGSFLPLESATDSEVEALFFHIYSDGLEALKAHFS